MTKDIIMIKENNIVQNFFIHFHFLNQKSIFSKFFENHKSVFLVHYFSSIDVPFLRSKRGNSELLRIHVQKLWER